MLGGRLLAFVSDRLHMKQSIERIGFDAFHHAGEEVKPFTFIFDQRIFLSVAAETDAVAKMVHPQQVILPMMIDYLEHERLLKKAQKVRSQLLFLFGIGIPHVGSKIFLQCVAPDIAERVTLIMLTLGDVQAELTLHDLM